MPDSERYAHKISTHVLSQKSVEINDLQTHSKQMEKFKQNTLRCIACVKFRDDPKAIFKD